MEQKVGIWQNLKKKRNIDDDFLPHTQKNYGAEDLKKYLLLDAKVCWKVQQFCHPQFRAL